MTDLPLHIGHLLIKQSSLSFEQRLAFNTSLGEFSLMTLACFRALTIRLMLECLIQAQVSLSDFFGSVTQNGLQRQKELREIVQPNRFLNCSCKTWRGSRRILLCILMPPFFTTSFFPGHILLTQSFSKNMVSCLFKSDKTPFFFLRLCSKRWDPVKSLLILYGTRWLKYFCTLYFLIILLPRTLHTSWDFLVDPDTSCFCFLSCFCKTKPRKSCFRTLSDTLFLPTNLRTCFFRGGRSSRFCFLLLSFESLSVLLQIPFYWFDFLFLFFNSSIGFCPVSS